MSPVTRTRVQGFLKRLLFALVAGAAGITLFAYAADYGLYRYRLGTNRAFGQVTVTNYDAVQQKNGKTQFIFDPPRPQTCVHSLFSHAGYSPCWYLQRHSEQRTNI